MGRKSAGKNVLGSSGVRGLRKSSGGSGVRSGGSNAVAKKMGKLSGRGKGGLPKS